MIKQMRYINVMLQGILPLKILVKKKKKHPQKSKMHFAYFPNDPHFQ